MTIVRVAISIGDPAGIGPEVTVKALKVLGRMKNAAFFVVGDAFALGRFGFKPAPSVTLVVPKNMKPACFKPGAATREAARAGLAYLDKAVSLIKEGAADCLVTAPLSKESASKAGFSWPGHTEYLAHAFGVKHVEMVFVAERLKVVLVTRHSALREAIRMVTAAKIIECGRLVLGLLKNTFRLKHPRIAVCGLNPHSSERGLFGTEEEDRIIPAIKKLNNVYGRHFFGPFASDTVFHKACQGEFDMVMAMYHDQGLIPFKLIAFDEGVHLTAGLPFIRTSPVHGTAFDIAGKNIADHRSMLAALLLAMRLTRMSL